MGDSLVLARKHAAAPRAFRARGNEAEWKGSADLRPGKQKAGRMIPCRLQFFDPDNLHTTYRTGMSRTK
jgi:hypothetical protein